MVPSITPFQFGDPVSGERVSVLCSLTDDLSDVRIDWYRDSFPISTSDSIRVNRIDEVTSSLSIPSLSPEFNGNYTCRISSASHPHVATNWTSTLVVNGNTYNILYTPPYSIHIQYTTRRLADETEGMSRAFSRKEGNSSRVPLFLS